MSRSLNEVKIIGNVGVDPEVRSTTGGNRVASLSVATSRQWSDAAGAKQEKTEWHRVVVWGKLADVIEKYVRKGDKVYLSGRIEYRQWQDKDGQTRYTTEINANELIMLGGTKGASTNGGNGGTVPAGTQRVRENAATRAAAKADENQFEDFPAPLTDDTDDLPF